jgi:hypothetical protein
VAGISISMLRYTANGSGAAGVAHSRLADNDVVPVVPVVPAAMVGVASAAALVPATVDLAMAAARRGGTSEPVSYVTPASAGNVNTALRTELADFIVAHSEYSTPLMRRNLLSALVTNEEGADSPVPGAAMAAAPARAAAGAVHATIAASGSSR